MTLELEYNQRMHIELEYRTEIKTTYFDKVKNRFDELYKKDSHTIRLTIMGFLNTEEAKHNIRIRITKNINTGKAKSEIAIKQGKYCSHDRTENELEIDNDKFLDFTKLFCSIIPGKEIVLERETINYKVDENITFSLVKAVNNAYIEFEIISQENNKNEDAVRLMKLINNLGFEALNEDDSKTFFKKLDTEDDWLIDGTDEEYKKLENLLEKYLH